MAAGETGMVSNVFMPGMYSYFFLTKQIHHIVSTTIVGGNARSLGFEDSVFLTMISNLVISTDETQRI